MNVGAPTGLASYAYQQAGGGSPGVLAALAALKASGSDVAGLVQSAGAGQGFDALQASQDSGLEVGTFGLQEAAGLGSQALQALLHPPLGFANPLLSTQSFLGLDAATTYASYLFAQAQRTDQGGADAQYALDAATNAVRGSSTDLLAPEPAPNAFTAATYNRVDGNQDGLISPAESLTYALSHPNYDPQDANLDGFVSPAEALAYELRHSESGFLFDGFV